MPCPESPLPHARSANDSVADVQFYLDCGANDSLAKGTSVTALAKDLIIKHNMHHHQ